MFIDADAHVIECADTWSYFPKSALDFRPAEMVFDEGQEPTYLAKRPSRGIFIDGQIYRHIIRSDEATGTTADIRELRDIGGRLKHMDEVGVGVQVLYPTTFLTEVTRRPEVEVPICQSYNRWIGDRCRDSDGRLRWVALLPYHSIPDALDEMRRAKEDGATGVFKRGFECTERRAGDPYFHPIYELAQELDMAICMHTAHPYTGNYSNLTKTQPGLFPFTFLMDAFVSVLQYGVCKKFPQLRFGFVEAGSAWLPYALWMASFEAVFGNLRHESAASERRGEVATERLAELLHASKLYVTCEASEDLEYLIGRFGDDNFCIGTDYAHADRASMMRVHRAMFDRGDLSEQSATKLTETNSGLLYGVQAPAFN